MHWTQVPSGLSKSNKSGRAWRIAELRSSLSFNSWVRCSIRSSNSWFSCLRASSDCLSAVISLPTDWISINCPWLSKTPCLIHCSQPLWPSGRKSRFTTIKLEFCGLRAATLSSKFPKALMSAKSIHLRPIISSNLQLRMSHKALLAKVMVVSGSDRRIKSLCCSTKSPYRLSFCKRTSSVSLCLNLLSTGLDWGWSPISPNDVAIASRRIGKPSASLKVLSLAE